MSRSAARAIAMVVAACGAIVACKSSKTNPPTPIAPEPSTSAQPDAAPRPDDVVDFGAPGPLAIAPPLPPLEIGNQDHAKPIGWSADGTTLGACVGAPMVTRCWLLGRDGKSDAFDDDLGNGFVDPKKEAPVRARVTSLGLSAPSAPRWRYARDVELTWMVIEDPKKAAPSAPAMLRIGARVRGGPTSWIVTLSDPSKGGVYYTIHPELLALSPDGASLGVIAHAFCGEYCNSYPMQVLDPNAVAAHAYNDAGFARHQKEDWAGSVDFFHEATAADPTFGLAHYNLACAYARIGDARAERELKKAIDLGDANEVKARAATDADFTSVRTQAWFVALTK